MEPFLYLGCLRIFVSLDSNMPIEIFSKNVNTISTPSTIPKLTQGSWKAVEASTIDSRGSLARQSASTSLHRAGRSQQLRLDSVCTVGGRVPTRGLQ